MSKTEKNDYIKEMFPFDVSQYEVPWFQVFRDHIGKIPGNSVRPLPIIYLTDVLGAYINEHASYGYPISDELSSILARLMAHHLEHSSHEQIKKGVFELLHRVKKEDQALILPAIGNYLQTRIPVLDASGQIQLMKCILKQKTIWPFIPNNAWGAMTKLADNDNDRYACLNALHIIAEVAPSPYATTERLNKGARYIVRSHTYGSDILSVERMIEKMADHPRSLLIWSKWIGLKKDATPFENNQMYVQMMDTLRTYPLNGTIIDTWQIWSDIMELSTHATSAELKASINKIQSANSHIHEYYMKVIPFIDTLSEDSVEKHQLLLEGYLRNQAPAESSIGNTRLFEI